MMSLNNYLPPDPNTRICVSHDLEERRFLYRLASLGVVVSCVMATLILWVIIAGVLLAFAGYFQALDR
jgi:hypothetical protein